MKQKFTKKIGLIGLILISIFFVGCGVVTPQFSYQGKLTDASGDPLDGAYNFKYSLYNADTSGDLIYTETEKGVTVEDGLFNSVIGPGSVVGGLAPEDFSQPLWLEVQVGNGTITETLTPRQKLYGAPYAFTLMPSAVISATLDQTLAGADGRVKAVLNVENHADPSDTLPALRVVGAEGIELSDLGTGASGVGTLYSRQSGIHTDLAFYSNDEVDVHLDHDNNSGGWFSIYNGAGTRVYYVTELGSYVASGTKSATVSAQDGQRLVYTIESPEVWLEDFGAGQLQNGAVQMTIDPIFASSVDLIGEYHVFLTPLGDSNGLYVTNKTAVGFEVRESGGGSSGIAFDYRIVAHRAGYESLRMPLEAEAFNVEQDVEVEK